MDSLPEGKNAFYFDCFSMDLARVTKFSEYIWIIQIKNSGSVLSLISLMHFETFLYILHFALK